MKLRLFMIVALITALSQLLVYSPGHAGAPTERVRAMMEEVIAIQTDPRFEGTEHREERRSAIKKIIGENINFNAMATKALGEHHKKLTGARRTEFVNIFRDLFQDSYSRLVLNFIKREKVLYSDETLADSQATVMTTIVRANDEIAVDYTLSQANGKWLVDDVKVDGVSIADNYSKSFDRVIKTQSLDALLERMRLQQKAIAGS